MTIVTNLHCSQYITLCHLQVWWPETCNGLPGVYSTGVPVAAVGTTLRSSGKTLGSKYFVIGGFLVTLESLDQWLGEDEVVMMVWEGPSTTCQVTRLHWEPRVSVWCL